ncbi:Homocitrate synthase [Purpureocillium lilacinum]|uniref:Homocitrate synthase n=2 Tax=Purpureocillium lilacinum TaxID=33203 RepID=A0A2U3EHV9_PURLI|nr:hypothetical protein Purlil1_697 [Purpureocillium lilacinum]PWI74098.1 Homocitrate synthase [Purpureocillium lilacinum]
MGNGANSSSDNVHGDAAHPIGHHTSHTMENGASSGGGGSGGDEGAHEDGTISNDNGLHAALVSEATLTTPTSASFFENRDTFGESGDFTSSSNVGNFSIIDSTLREGEQFATAYFSTAQKIKIAQALDDFGVEYIEVTSPAASEQSRADCETICKLGLKAKILCHIRCDINDARIAVETGVDGINMCIGTSSQLMKHSHGKDLTHISTKAKEVIEFVNAHGIEVRFSGEDSFRSNFDDLLNLYSLVDRLGVRRVGIADTVGVASSRDVFNKISALRRVVGCDIETHFHNDTGCAVANAYTALEAGATHIDTTVLGIGERNGITSLGGLVASLLPTERKYVLSKYKVETLSYLDSLVAQIVGVEVPFNNFAVSHL